MQSEPIEVVAVVDGAADVGVEETEVETEERPTTLQHLRRPAVQDIKDPNILIFQLVSGQDVPCTSNMGKELFSAQNLPPVHGRTSTLNDLLNEILTSLVNP